MSLPGDLFYTQTHEWVRFVDDDTARVGLTDHAQEALGDLVYVNLPQEGDEARRGEGMGDVESVKAVSDVFSPFTGVVSAVNAALLDEPGLINTDPYGAWLVEISAITDREQLLDAQAYEALCAQEG
jgi:glycine cleavage system H protein